METTFDINSFDKATQSKPATYNQCRGLSLKFAKAGDKIDWKLQNDNYFESYDAQILLLVYTPYIL